MTAGSSSSIRVSQLSSMSLQSSLAAGLMAGSRSSQSVLSATSVPDGSQDPTGTPSTSPYPSPSLSG